MFACKCTAAGIGRTKITTRTRWVNPWKLYYNYHYYCPVVTAITPAYKRVYGVYRSYLCYSSQGHVWCRQCLRRRDDDFIPFAARTRAHTHTPTPTHARTRISPCRFVDVCEYPVYIILISLCFGTWSWYMVYGADAVDAELFFSLYFSLRLSPPKCVWHIYIYIWRGREFSHRARFFADFYG